jgi:ABC-type multidrug transport system fused ATPase/permease subunit
MRGGVVLAIDEGTANLDGATDATIQRALTRYRRRAPARDASATGAPGAHAGPRRGSSAGALASLAPPGCSIIVVAHRLDTVAGADKLLVMSQGRVLESGRPAELEAQGGVYSAMLRVMRDAEAAAAAACG